MSTPLFTQPEPVVDSAAMSRSLLPEIMVFVTVAAVLFFPSYVPWLNPDALDFTIGADAALLMFSATLVDVASRLRRAPPWWLGLLLCAGMLLMYPDGLGLILHAWQVGLWIFLPFVWSFYERLRQLWTLPSASELEKIRRRTMTFDRLYTALVLGVLWVVGLVLGSMLSDARIDFFDWAVLAFYGTATFNAWRVHQPAFAKRPRSLWPWIDGGQGRDLSPL